MIDSVRIFHIQPSFATLHRIVFWGGLILTFTLVALALYSKTAWSLVEPEDVLWCWIGAAVTALLSWGAYRLLKLFPVASVAIDRSGIWPAHLPRLNALVRWDAVAQLRERPSLQRLELQDAAGAVLIKLEYQLEGFNDLREAVLEHIPSPEFPVLPALFAKSSFYHVAHVVSSVVIVGIGFWLGSQEPVVGYVLMPLLVAFVLFDYCSRVSGVALTHQTLTLMRPLGNHDLQRDDIEWIEQRDSYYKTAKVPEVWVLERGQPKLDKLHNLGIDAITLSLILKQWYDAND